MRYIFIDYLTNLINKVNEDYYIVSDYSIDLDILCDYFDDEGFDINYVDFNLSKNNFDKFLVIDYSSKQIYDEYDELLDDYILIGE